MVNMDKIFGPGMYDFILQYSVSMKWIKSHVGSFDGTRRGTSEQQERGLVPRFLQHV